MYYHHLSGPEVGHSHRLYCQKGPAEVVLPSPDDEVQPATGAAETVLLCHHWICTLHVNNCLVQLSYQIWPQKTTECSPDYWANHWYNPPHSPRTVLIQSEQKVLAKSLWTPHIQHTPSLYCYRLVDATEHWATEWPGTGTVSSLRQSRTFEHLTINMKHTTLSYIYLFNTHTYYISKLHLTYLYILNCLFFTFAYYYFYYMCLVLSLSFCCTVELLSPKQIPRMCKHTWQYS